MINLSRNRAELLAEIGAPDPAGYPLSDINDPRVATGDAHVRICGHTLEDLFPLLRIALSERFAAVPRPQLIRDLLMPLKSALGNAYKHGNGNDPAKAIFVEIVLTCKGTLIAVTDQGRGFDAALTFRRFQEQESYFVNHGSGFRHLHRTMSTVTYENGGRTVLLCFRPTMEDRDHASPSWPTSAGAPTAAPEETPSGGHPLPNILDSGWIQTCLSAELPEFGNGRARIESCRVYATCGRADDDCGNRYVVRVASHDGRAAETRILTGKLRALEADAEADVEAATRLRDARISTSVLIPRPVVRLAREPRLVLYDFDPWMNLWEYLAFWRSLGALRNCAERIARALARLHRSPVVFRGVEPDLLGEGLHAMVAHAEANLQTVPYGLDLVNRFRASVQRIGEWAASGRQRTLAPIHGSPSWDCIYYGVDGFFYLYRFETCRLSDPGLDLGGFAADLLRFTLASRDEGAYRICNDAFLTSYNARAEHAMGGDDLRFYIGLAIVERLRRAPPRTRADAEELLATLDAALRSRAGCRV